MSKFQKRIQKLHSNSENCLVIGKSFGFLKEILEIYKTVFVIDDLRPELKSRNLVYRQNLDDLHNLTEITVIFFDLNLIDQLSSIMHLAVKYKSLVVIEGNEPIGRNLSGPLYRHGYQCTGLHGFFHVWELK